MPGAQGATPAGGSGDIRAFCTAPNVLRDVTNTVATTAVPTTTPPNMQNVSGDAPDMRSAGRKRRVGRSDKMRNKARCILRLELHGLSFPAVIRHCEPSITRLVSAAFSSDDSVHSALLDMHKRACRSIRDIACMLHRHGIIPVVSTHINVFFLWHAWMQAMSAADALEERDQRKGAMKAFRAMYRGKLTVIVPALCFLVSMKFIDGQQMQLNNMKHIIDLVSQKQDDYARVKCSRAELWSTEYDLLHLLQWDVAGSQERVDRVEDILYDHMGDEYRNPKVQSQVVALLSRIFRGIPSVQ